MTSVRHSPETRITPDAVASFRSQLTIGEDVVDPSTWAGSVPVAHGIAPAGPDRREPVVQPAVAAADRVRAADRRGRRRRRACATCRRCSSSSPATRAPSRRRRRARSGLAGLGRGAALLQPVPDDLHHPLRAADPRRPSAAVLDPALHPGQGLVPDPEAGAGRPAVDGEAGLDQPARPGRAARASGTRSGWPAGGTWASTRCGCSTALVFYVLLFATGAVAAHRADELGGVPQRRVGADPVPVAGLAGRERLGRLQRPAADRLLHHRLHRRPAGVHHRAGHVAGAVDAVQADQQACSASRPRARCTSSCCAGSCSSSSSTSRWCSPPGLLRNLNHIYAGRDDDQLGRLLDLRRVDGGGRRRLGRGHAVHAAPPAGGAAGRLRADRPGAAAVRARRRQARRSTPRRTSRRTSGTTASTPTPPEYQRAVRRRLRRLPAADQRPRRATRSSSTSRSCARCRTTSRSPSTSASRAGPASPSGAACRCRPSSTSSSRSPEAKWVVFYSLGDGPDERHLLRRASDRADELPPDDARLRHERRAAVLRPRRAAAAAQRGPARLQAGEVDQGHRVRRATSPRSAAATAATTKTTSSSATGNPSRQDRT